MTILPLPAVLTPLLLIALSGPGPDSHGAAPVPVSDQVGVYGLIDKVIRKPDDTAPTAVEIQGAFAVAEGPHGDYYRSPRWGSLTFRLTEGEEDKCRAQWADLASLAGTGQCVGFGFRYQQRGVKVYRRGDPEVKAIDFQTGMGVHKVRNVDYGPVQQLRTLARPLSPTFGDKVESRDPLRPMGKVTFTVANCLDNEPATRYLFEVERAGGDIRASEPVAPGDDKTSWSVLLALTPGETIRWRVRTVCPGVPVAAVAEASFIAIEPRK